MVTANKTAVAKHYDALHACAEAGGVRLAYSAAVGGGAPVLETVARAAARGRIGEITCILNGTVNFILDRLADGIPADVALREARDCGFAEEDCEADLSGADSAAKLRIVAREAFGIDETSLDVTVERLDAVGFTRIGASGERWVQVARLKQQSGSLEASVRLRPLSAIDGLPPVSREWNCAAITLVDGRILSCSGRGAGGPATAEAIVGDLYDIVRRRDQTAPGTEAQSRIAAS